MTVVARRAALLAAVALVALVVGTLAKGATKAPSYDHCQPFELALMADVIIDGTIIDCAGPITRALSDDDRRTFTIRVDAVIAGEATEKELVVSEFVNWTCAYRYARYAEGQRALFHLTRARDNDGCVHTDAPLRILGAGNEGECPIIGDDVLHAAWGWHDVSREKHTAFGWDFSGVASPRDEYVAAISGLLACYRWDRGTGSDRPFPPEGFHQVGSDEQLAAFEASSSIAARFVLGVRELEAWWKR